MPPKSGALSPPQIKTRLAAGSWQIPTAVSAVGVISLSAGYGRLHAQLQLGHIKLPAKPSSYAAAASQGMPILHALIIFYNC
jgi:hypothetical protein